MTPETLIWDQILSLLLCCVHSRWGKSETETCSSPPPSFPWFSSLVHKLLGRSGSEELVHPRWPPTAAAFQLPVSLCPGVISSWTPASWGSGPSWRWLGSWRVWHRCRVVSVCRRRPSRRSERPAAPRRPRRRCHGDCSLCCPPGCRRDWPDRWPLASDLMEMERVKQQEKCEVDF